MAAPGGDEPVLPDGADLGDFKMPPLEDLLKSLEGMENLSEDDKKALRDSLLARAGNKEDFLHTAEAIGAAAKPGMAPDILVLLLMVTIITLVFAFFGYKLYKSLVDRERRREEKKRQKQQKKKK